jgi:hypothetical protein
MDTLERADMFFFITSIAVVIGTIAWGVVAYYLILAFRQIRRLSEKLEENMDDASDEVRDLVFDIRESFLYRTLFRKGNNRKR